jgi:hypothetical protein
LTETDFRVVPLTPELWPALEDLFGPQGPCYGCWCNHFRMPPKLRKPLLGEGARQLFEERVEKGPPPGVLAFCRRDSCRLAADRTAGACARME